MYVTRQVSKAKTAFKSPSTTHLPDAVHCWQIISHKMKKISFLWEGENTQRGALLGVEAKIRTKYIKKRSTNGALFQRLFSALGGIRTHDLRFRRPLLYPAELRGQYFSRNRDVSRDKRASLQSSARWSSRGVQVFRQVRSKSSVYCR